VLHRCLLLLLELLHSLPISHLGVLFLLLEILHEWVAGQRRSGLLPQPGLHALQFILEQFLAFLGGHLLHESVRCSHLLGALLSGQPRDKHLLRTGLIRLQKLAHADRVV